MNKAYLLTRLARFWALLLAMGLASSYQLNATTCANATVISSLPFSGATNCSGNDITSANASACVSTLYYGGNEALFTYTPATSGSVLLTFSGQSWSQISVYAGCPTSGGSCVTGISSSASSKSITASLTAGTQYYFLVDTWPSPPSPCPGTFSVEALVPTVNDECVNAIMLSVGDTDTGNTLTADDDNPPTCGGAGDGSGGGVWYVVTGTGLDITAATCGSGFDTQIAVYEGSCAALSCVAGNDDACGLQSSVTWNSLAGVPYYIYIDGFGAATGAYTLAITGLLPPPIDNDNCADANTITCGETVQGSTIGAFPDAVRSCGPGTAGGGVWYTFNPNDGGFIQSLSTCGAANFDTKITIYYGDCNRLRCLGSLDNTSGCANGTTEMLFTPFFGRTHYVLVQPVNPAMPGVFDLTYDCDASAARTPNATVFAANVEENYETVKLYPNPVQDELNVELSGFLGDRVMMRIHNSLGQVVMQRSLGQAEEQVQRFNTSQLQSGMYYLTVQVEGKETFTEKFMVGSARP